MFLSTAIFVMVVLVYISVLFVVDKKREMYNSNWIFSEDDLHYISNGEYVKVLLPLPLSLSPSPSLSLSLPLPVPPPPHTNRLECFSCDPVLDDVCVCLCMCVCVCACR